jgi:hypothetical protein
MEYEYKVKVVFTDGRKDETGPIQGPDAVVMAYRQASYWQRQDVRHVQILRAEKTGINAGKFFLHQIMKG